MHTIGFYLTLGPGILQDLWAEAVRRAVAEERVTRTRTAAAESEVPRAVDPGGALHFEFVDLAGGNAPDQAPREYLQDNLVIPPELPQGSLWRNYLLRGRDGSFSAGLVAHRHVFDGLSAKWFFERIVSIYEGRRRGRSPERVTAPSISNDSAEVRRSCDLPAALAYWRSAIAVIEALEFHGTMGREAPNTCTGVALEADEVDAIRNHCAVNRLRPAAIFLTAYAYLLQRYADQDHAFLVQAAAESRPRRCVRTPGGFSRMLPVIFSGDLLADGTPTVAAVREVGRRVRTAARRSPISAAALREILGGHPVRCFFDYRPSAAIRVFGRSEVVHRVEYQEAEDVHLRVGVSGAAVTLELSCNPRHFHEVRFLDRLRGVIRQLCCGAERWQDVDIILGEERKRTALRGVGLAVPRDPAVSVIERFKEQAAVRGDSPAVVCEGRTLTYRQLAESSRRLADRLRAMGVGPECLVALCLERSPQLVVAILAILRAGGAYVPIDPVNPDERIRFLLDDCGAKVLVTESLLEKRCARPGIRVLCLDRGEESDRIGEERFDGSEAAIDLGQAAYVIYTSGSTGTPKGVVVTHANLARLFAATARWFDFDADDVWPLFHSFAFDVSVWELWGALLHGGRLVIVPGDVARSPADFLDLLVREKATVLNQTPSAFYQFDRADQARGGTDPLALRCVLFAGEALRLPALRGWVRRRGPEKPRLFNLYGITETTVHATCRPLTGRDIEDGAESVVGVPLADLMISVRDRRGRPRPPGLAGEFWVGGAGVARGYLNRAELTAQRFVEETAGGEAAVRFYRSGDRGRILPGVELEYLGRLDHQVQVRGFRVEPGEIETALLQHPAVREAVVTALENGPDEVRLIAYVVTEAGRPVAVSALRRFLGTRLPGYMMPTRFVYLQALPLTPNGKVDRRSLPEPDESRPELDQSYTAPRTALEGTLAAVWQQLLRVGQVGIHDNFFDLGGHSLAAAQLLARVNEALHTDLPLSLVFSHPTIAALAAELEAARSRSRVPPGLEIEPQPRTGPPPCSFSQERVWFLQQMAPENRAYDSLDTIRFTGPLDVAVLERALSEIIRRHEIYRTTFVAAAGRPGQIIHDPWTVKLTVTDLRGYPPAERPDAEEREIRRACHDPFRLDRLPLVRWSLVQTEDAAYTLIHFEHHIVHDGWSFIVFLRELLQLYRAFAAGEPSPLPEPEIQFADFAAWQRRWLAGPVRAAQLAYWQRTLQGAPVFLDLPTDHPRPPLQTFAGHTFRRDLPPDLAQALGPAARAGGVTVFMILLAAFAVLLQRYTGQEDMVIGSGVANRRWRRSEALLGMIINNVALRCELAGDPSFRDLTRRIKTACLGALENQDVPFDAVVEALNPPRSPSHTPLFQAFFTSFDGEVPELALPGIRVEYEEGLSVGAAKFDLNVIAITRKKGPGPGDAATTFLIWEFNADLFDVETMGRMLDHYIHILRTALADPDRRLAELTPLTPAEKALVLGAWSGRESAYPRQQGIPEVFEDVARRMPAATALCGPGPRLTYEELNARANQMAHVLREIGVRPGVLVGLCLERHPEMIVATLGILKAGGVYVPLDPAYPPLRLAYLLKDTQAPVLITRERLLANLPPYGGRTLCLDRDRRLIDAAPQDNPAVGAGPDSLAYIMYTSGSTGTPKGVCIPHRGVVRLVKGVDYVHLSPAEVLLQLAPISFDAATFEIWGALLNGGRLVVCGPEKLSLQELGAVIQREGVTTLWLTAPLFHQMAEDHLEGLRGVKQLVAGGDVLAPASVRRVLTAYPDCVVVNGYGPTENTTFTCCHRLTEAAAVGDRVPIGRPIANTRVFILDPSRRPVPIGVAGELYVGGDGLAQGYWHAPELTAERFVEPPPGISAGGALYRTGDRGRYGPDGLIEFLGRLDSQAKVRGFRVEPGEIEAVLCSHPGVRQAVVAVRPTPEGGKRLDAYAEAAEGVEVSALRAFLRERLPDYLIPAGLAIVKAFTLTPSGKIDRAALPEPQKTGGPLTAPRTRTEEALAAIWAELLGLQAVGVQANFFDLGGHSLLATRIASRVQSRFGVVLPLRAIFSAPTIAELAAVVESLEQGGPAGQEAPLVPVARTRHRSGDAQG